MATTRRRPPANKLHRVLRNVYNVVIEGRPMVKKTVMSGPTANCAPMERLPFPCVIAANAITHDLKLYDRKELTQPELARKIMDSLYVLTTYERQRLREYFNSCIKKG